MAFVSFDTFELTLVHRGVAVAIPQDWPTRAKCNKATKGSFFSLEWIGQLIVERLIEAHWIIKGFDVLEHRYFCFI